jgi:hypothetical protein
MHIISFVLWKKYFWLRLFVLHPLFQECNLDVKQDLGLALIKEAVITEGAVIVNAILSM